jgi:Protein of unknown function (DUF1579)
MRRGLPSRGHAALSLLIGTWRVRYEVYGTLGRRGDEPPIVSDDVRTRREWVGGGRFIEDTTEGTLMGAPLWRRGWLGYNNMDRRYEWVTIDSVNSTMMVYVSETGSGSKQPIIMDGAFTDQGVAGEKTVGKRVGMRTVIRMDTEDHHVFELYFRRPGQKDVLAVRSVYTAVPKWGDFLSMSGTFTDQGLISEQTAGRRIAQRTVIRIRSEDRHDIDLYFTAPARPEMLIDHSVYTRLRD